MPAHTPQRISGDRWQCSECKEIMDGDGNFKDSECPGKRVRIPGTFETRLPEKPGPKPQPLPDNTPTLPGFFS